MRGRPTVTVAGAGALGLSCALALAEAGCAVTICDPGEPFGNASGVAGGMLAPVFEAVLDAEADPQFDLLLAARNLWPERAARSGVRLDRSGTLAAGSAAWLGKVSGGATRLGVHPTELPAITTQALAPGLAATNGALLNREDWRLDPRAALGALRAAAKAEGVTFQPQAVQGRGEADILVVATGAGASGLAPELAALTPIKGHILRVATAGSGGLTVRGDGVYVIPGDAGWGVGATMEPGVGDPAVDPAKGPPLLAAGARLFPALAEAAYDLFAGVRAATPDGLPLVGWSAEPGVVLATGARRNGWLLAPLVAHVVAACVTEGEAGPYAARFDPRRFAGAA
jgi:glycine oxidase